MPDVSFSMGLVGVGILALGAIAIGLVFEYVGDGAAGYEWVVTSIAAFIGGFVASEYMGDVSSWGPSVDGLAVSAALVVAALLGATAAVLARLATSPTEFDGHGH